MTLADVERDLTQQRFVATLWNSGPAVLEMLVACADIVFSLSVPEIEGSQGDPQTGW